MTLLLPAAIGGALIAAVGFIALLRERRQRTKQSHPAQSWYATR